MIRTVFLAAISFVMLAGEALAQDRSNPFARLAGRDAEERQVSALWFERADGGGRFIFDQSNDPALLWPDGSEEVYGLRPSRASGGGEVWVNDMDSVMLRFTNLGGATYFPPDAPDGVIVDTLGRAQTLVAAPASTDEVEEAARELVDELARISDNDISAQIPNSGYMSNAYTIDTLRMIFRATDQVNRADLRNIQGISIEISNRPSARYEDGILRLTINPEQGYGGRPSSARIADAIRN